MSRGFIKVHVITASARTGTLSKIAKGLENAVENRICDIHWHIMFDPHCEHPGGQGIKNKILDDIDDGWVWILDDDTVVHPDFFKTVIGAIRSIPGTRAVVVSQQRDKRGGILQALPSNLFVGGIDTGQAFMSREIIGDKRIPEHYCGDGEFLANVLKDQPNVVFLIQPLSIYNALRYD